MIFQSNKILLLYDIPQLKSILYGEPSLFWSLTEQIQNKGGDSFSGDLVQVMILFCFPVSFVQKTPSTVRQLLYCYKQFRNVTRKYMKRSLQFPSVQQVVSNFFKKMSFKENMNHSLKNSFWIKDFYKASNFESKVLQRVLFWSKNFTTCQILNWKNYNAFNSERNSFVMSDFEFIKIQSFGLWNLFCHFRFCEKVSNRKITFWLSLFRENGTFCLFHASSKNLTLKETFYNILQHFLS